MTIKSADLFIFDLDGTIVDSSKTVLKILNLIRRELKIEEIQYKDALPVLSHGGIEMISKVIGSNFNADYYLDYFRSIYTQDNLESDKIFDGAVDFINQLIKKNKKIALCSNKPRDLIYKVLHHHKLHNSFQIIIAGSDVKNKKPNPEGIDKIIVQSFAEKEKTLMIGDSVVDQDAAFNAKIKFIFFEGGYDDGVDKTKISLKFNNYRDLLRELE